MKISQGPSLQSMAELDEISRVQSHFSPHFLLIFLIYLARALAILCKLARGGSRILLGGGAPLRNGVTNPSKPHFFAEYQLY